MEKGFGEREWTHEDFARLLAMFCKKYEDLYEGVLTADVSALAKTFDKMMADDEAFCDIVSGFVDVRKDYISSDREAAAFMLAISEYVSNPLLAVKTSSPVTSIRGLIGL